MDQVEVEVPPFATPERALARYARRRDGDLRTIRFFPDAGNAGSLWEVGSASYVVDPAELQLSEALLRDLFTWHDEWERATFGGVALPADWERRGDDLLGRVRQEAWDLADIIDGR
ncbi:hypothetical protein [Leifsonia xyli]|uniref:hypothetical protein n=1 Tax=Leifsonia xyli TaxID=1575 RepID=UPI003D669770